MFPQKIALTLSSSLCFFAIITVLLIPLLVLGQGAPERFRAEPQDIVAAKGQIKFFNCTIENQVGMVQWLRNGFGLGFGTEFEGFPRYKVQRNQNLGEHVLMVTNIQLEDDATFECQVGATETTQGLKSRKAKLTVLLPPDLVTIEGAPVVEVMADDVHNLTCQANNSKPAPHITWRNGHLPVDNNVTTLITKQGDGKREDVTSWLTIYPQKLDQGRIYECSAYNGAMSQRMWTSVQLDVIYPPEVTMLSTPHEQLKEFQTLFLNCSAASNPAVSSWRWFLEDELIDQSSNVLILERVDRQLHGKTVSCEAINKAGSGRKKITLDIIYSPAFKTMEENIAADPGDSVNMFCSVDSNPKPTIVWRKKGYIQILSSDATFLFRRVTDENFGTYICTATLFGFEDISQAIQLLKKGPPKIINAQEQSARYGEVGVIDCTVRAIPKPNFITWHRDNKQLDLSILTRYKIREEDVKHGRRSILEISSVQNGDFGIYNCTTNNGYGHDHMAISLSRKAMLPLPFIVAGVLSGILVIIIVLVAVFVYRRRKSVGSEKGSTGSECIMRKKDCLPDIKIEYSNEGAGSSNPPYSNAILDTWNVDPRYHSHYNTPVPFLMPYDPWNKPRYMLPMNNNPYVMIPQNAFSSEIYGTYPRFLRQNTAYRDDVFGPDMYGTLRGGLPQRSAMPYNHVPPPVSPTSSRLSTNV